MMDAFVISPLPSVLLDLLPTAGLLRSTDVTPLRRYYEPLRGPSRLPPISWVLQVIRLPCSADFTTGRGELLQLLRASSARHPQPRPADRRSKPCRRAQCAIPRDRRTKDDIPHVR